MRDPRDYPKLRWPLEVRLEQVEDQTVLLVRCPIGVTRDPLVLVAGVAPLVSAFDGSTSTEQIVKRFREYGITRQLVSELIGLLDEHLFLDTPRFHAAKQKLHAEFARAEVRLAALAGASYPPDEAALSREVDGYLQLGESNGIERGQLHGLLAPHIDYRRGGVCYGKTYTHLTGDEHDLYLLLGTAHQFSRRLFHMTRKDFASPLGLLTCDKKLVDEIAERHGEERSYADEYLHQNEHSLELQLPFLRRRDKAPRIMPILVGSLHEFLAPGRRPAESGEYQSFVGALAECVGVRLAQGERVCVISGVDLAHIGRAFGDEGSLSAERLEVVAERDRLLLDAVGRQDKEAFFEHIAEDQDARRVCGFPTIYTVMDLFERLGIRYRGELFDYRQAVDYQSDCAVTFAGMGLYGI